MTGGLIQLVLDRIGGYDLDVGIDLGRRILTWRDAMPWVCLKDLPYWILRHLSSRLPIAGAVVATHVGPGRYRSAVL